MNKNLKKSVFNGFKLFVKYKIKKWIESFDKS